MGKLGTQATDNQQRADKCSEQLEKQGFPDFMIEAFESTADMTNTVICSRVPGEATTPLIADHHDLKSFQIKAKSCDWGPMSGFLCQLPFLNKKGSEKISYNADYTAAYLTGIARFSATKKNISEQDADVKIAKNLTKEFKTEAAKRLKRSKEIMSWLDKLKKNEADKGEWTGENNLPNDDPFIHLKRTFKGDNNEVIAALVKLKGITKPKEIKGENIIYGTAKSDDQSVAIQYAIKKEDNNLWAIYHGEIEYLATTPPLLKALSKTIPTAVEITEETKSNLEKAFAFSDKTLQVDGKTYYAIRGFMNAFPPFAAEVTGTDGNPKNNPDFYKNAVSGDYDLFAIWPHVDAVGLQQLERITETSIGERLGKGGKIFTSFFDFNKMFGIEFIPGFSEINANKDKAFAETADFGNIHDWGRLVAGTLNSIAGADKISGNKAYHSDEGGRPGIMEIEFPVAVFFPVVLATKALNNAGKKPNKVLDRTPLKTQSGMFNSPIEVVMLNLECLKAGYRVMLHSDWMMHLFFCSLTADERSDFLNKKGDLYKYCTKDKANTASAKKIDKKIGEFKVIDKEDQKLKYDAKEYLCLLKMLVLAKLQSWKVTDIDNQADKTYPLYYLKETTTFDKPEEQLFKLLRKTLLSFAFQPNRKSIEKLREFEIVLTSMPRANHPVKGEKLPQILPPNGSIFSRHPSPPRKPAAANGVNRRKKTSSATQK
ncbi:MAG: hypothetical protein HRU06_08120 [Oceanospirillaceae bacterium]|nr:hypothetical protein [Oceanospirillaceae bacterium]